MLLIEEWMRILRSPNHRSPMTLVKTQVENNQIIRGELKTKTGSIYPITNGIIRISEIDNYAESFAYQFRYWKDLQFSSNNIGMSNMENHTKSMFEKITNNSDLTDKIIMDVGTGSGRFLKECIRFKPKLIIAIDYSDAIDVARDNLKDHLDKIIFIQCDALCLPVDNDVVDFTYSIGVLHHTEDYLKGFKEMVRTTKRKGNVCVSVYRKGYYCYRSVTVLRNFFNSLGSKYKFKSALIYSYFVVYCVAPIVTRIPMVRKYIRRIIPFVYLPDKRWSVLDTFDSVTPVYQRCFTADEVRKMFSDHKLSNIIHCDWGVTHIGTKE